MNNKSSLRFAPDILRRLGEELIPNPEQGIIELVKNSYDADALQCTINLYKVSEAGGSITIEDDGIGMDDIDLVNGFLVIGSSRKEEATRSKVFRRLQVGNKGLGRLAALRLGNSVQVISRPKSKPGQEYILKINWKEVDTAKIVEEIPLYIEVQNTDKLPGVTIQICDLKKPLKKEVVTRLANELLILSDPFQQKNNFKVKLLTPEFSALEKIVKEKYFEDADFYVKAEVDTRGKGKVCLYNGNNELIHQSTLPLKGKEFYNFPQLSFQLWIFVLGSNFSVKKTSVTKVKEWLRQVGGVHFYHRQIRVRPYGEPGSDWLDMNLARASHPEFRPSTNTVIGKIETEDSWSQLKQPTNRIGFVEDYTFNNIKNFAQEVLRWVSDFRLKEAEKDREKKKKEAIKESTAAMKEVLSIIRKSVPKSSVKEAEKAINHLKKAQEKEVLSLREDLQLYRSLATAGTTSAVFAHEAAKPITLLNTIAETIERRGKKNLSNEVYSSSFSDPVLKLKNISTSLNVYSQFPIYHLRKAKRVSGDLEVNKIWEDVTNLFMPLLKQAKITVDFKFDQEETKILGTIALIEAIATNLITNSIHALTGKNSVMQGRIIQIRSFVDNGSITIIHEDNGPGIQIELDTIWSPGVTTNPEGTGFGLTIVKDSVLDLKGTINAKANGTLGGAMFTLKFPISN